MMRVTRHGIAGVVAGATAGAVILLGIAYVAWPVPALGVVAVAGAIVLLFVSSKLRVSR